MQPAFARAAIESHCADVVGVTERALACWPREGVIDVAAVCGDVMLRIVMKCFYGLDEEVATRGIGRVVSDFMEIVTDPATILFPVDLPGSPYRRKLRLAEQFIGELRLLLARKRELGGTRCDAMSLLMEARDTDESRFSDDELIAEALELVVAGHDTSAMALTWTLFLLDQHPEVLRGLKAELDSVLGQRPPAPADLPQLGLLDRVVKESMRLLSPAPTLFLRTCVDDVMLGGYWLPKNANVLISPIATHHDPDIYPEPRRFSPSRWINWSPAPYAYLPFGGGSRTCIGMLFAAQAIRVVLAMILRQFLFRCEPGARVNRLTRGNIMHARCGLPMRVFHPNTPLEPPHETRGDVHQLVDLPGRRSH
jgi:cytochrome P450